MNMIIRATDKEGRPVPETGQFIEGNDCLALVEQMRVQTPFTARQTPDEYMEGLLARLPEKPPVRCGNAEQRAADFLSALATHGLVEFVADKVAHAEVVMTLEDPGPVFIPEQVLEDLEAIRRDGRSNMLDWPAVARIAEVMGMDRTAAWVRTHHREYSAGIFRGFAPDEKGIEACAVKQD